MEPLTITLMIATIFFTKALEKSGEIFSEKTIAKLGAAIAKIREHSPVIAKALEDGDRQVFQLLPGDLVQMATEPVINEFLTAVDAEPNQELKHKLAEVQATARQQPSMLAEKIGILVQAGGQVDIKTFNM
jgi:hypothetical protein